MDVYAWDIYCLLVGGSPTLSFRICNNSVDDRINYGMGRDVDPEAPKQWQIPVGLQMVSGACLFFGIFTVPESVRWYLKQGRAEDAWKSLTWVRASDSQEVHAEFAEMQAGLEAEKELKTGVRRAEIMFGENRSRVIQGSLAFFFQQVKIFQSIRGGFADRADPL